MNDLHLRKDDVAITNNWAREICRIGHGSSCCRYLTMGANGWSCEKHTGLGSIFDRRVREESIVARGDNCGGRMSK